MQAASMAVRGRSGKPSPSAARSTSLSGATTLGSLVLTALLPKCPLCVAAVLSALGVGAAASTAVAPFVRPLAYALMLLAVANLAWTVQRIYARRKLGAERRRPPCCG